MQQLSPGIVLALNVHGSGRARLLHDATKMIGEIICRDAGGVRPRQRFIDPDAMVVPNRVRARSAGPLFDDVFRIVDVLMRQTRGDLLGSSSLPVVLEGRQRRRAFFDFDQLIQRVPVVRLRPVTGEIAIRVLGVACRTSRSVDLILLRGLIPRRISSDERHGAGSRAHLRGAAEVVA